MGVRSRQWGSVAVAGADGFDAAGLGLGWGAVRRRLRAGITIAAAIRCVATRVSAVGASSAANIGGMRESAVAASVVRMNRRRWRSIAARAMPARVPMIVQKGNAERGIAFSAISRLTSAAFAAAAMARVATAAAVPA